ncbi:isoprenoid synthase domain-containing protein [Xylaria cf. heliscus]|nr:isoprenoid synthase domain-containing protein [Xylaria cf. heliscus]
MHTTSDKVRNQLKPLLVQFEKALGYTSPRAGNDRRALFEGMHREAARIGIPYPEGSRSWHSFQTGANYAYLCYANLPLEIRIYTGVFTWLAVLVDDSANEDPKEWHQFVPRFLGGDEDQHHSDVAREWDRWLRLSYQFYSPVVANFIITSSLNFANACALEGSEMPKMTRTKGGENWAFYIRDKNGIAEAYAWMTFPKAICPDVACYMEAMPDMNRWICFTNDILSLYKEECALETDNYMHSRASYEGVGIYEVLRQVIEETVDAHRRIALVLEGKKPYAQFWNDHVLGFVAFHKTTERYRLQDLGLGERLP